MEIVFLQIKQHLITLLSMLSFVYIIMLYFGIVTIWYTHDSIGTTIRNTILSQIKIVSVLMAVKCKNYRHKLYKGKLHPEYSLPYFYLFKVSEGSDEMVTHCEAICPRKHLKLDY